MLRAAREAGRPPERALPRGLPEVEAPSASANPIVSFGGIAPLAMRSSRLRARFGIKDPRSA